MIFLSSPFPLEHVSDQQLQRLCEVLWSWKICLSCKAGQGCTTPHCSWPRSQRLAGYFAFYKDITALYVPEFLPGSHPALRSHEDLFEIIRVLKSQPDVPRFQLTKHYFSTRDGGNAPMPPISDQDRAVSLAVRAMAMVKCSAEKQSLDFVELGTKSLQWRQEISLSQFVTEAFPETSHPALSEKDNTGSSLEIKAQLTAQRLKKIAGLKFQPTSDLGEHLKLDQKLGVVHIFHHTAFLTEHLIASQSISTTVSVGKAIELANIPRQLALESLDSVQRILFPPDIHSQSLLRSLVSKAAFDPDCLRFESAPYRSDDENDITYHHFCSRLMDLYDETISPTPRSLVDKWVEKRSGARHVMMATLVGVIIAIILGILSLAVSIFQAWVGYQAWKHPLPNV
ncbi:uncharacterized protein PV07_09269 [Cladophialophora immunda]|uniref:Uncharacterized protein n=1 Tax=Cladophialophora immunda TaxID=569365 RepID=A0A0D2CRB1_9EURO|nr:uncharacterized protein PV07_09269 [Cladophialophora immunda]KIW26149.1 hypothetical protein PV07_09269 [Cladophialophora immunda]OQU95975.1 hypothetical protein CLAIMM_02122 [Cladophialophora immunda]